jgi:hypothetical protein
LRHKEREAAYAEHRRTWQQLIESWLAPPQMRNYRDDGPHIPIDDILEHLEPPEWLTIDPGPPGQYASAPAGKS